MDRCCSCYRGIDRFFNSCLFGYIKGFIVWDFLYLYELNGIGLVYDI